MDRRRFLKLILRPTTGAFAKAGMGLMCTGKLGLKSPPPHHTTFDATERFNRDNSLLESFQRIFFHEFDD